MDTKPIPTVESVDGGPNCPCMIGRQSEIDLVLESRKSDVAKNDKETEPQTETVDESQKQDSTESSSNDVAKESEIETTKESQPAEWSWFGFFNGAAQEEEEAKRTDIEDDFEKNDMGSSLSQAIASLMTPKVSNRFFSPMNENGEEAPSMPDHPNQSNSFEPAQSETFDDTTLTGTYDESLFSGDRYNTVESDTFDDSLLTHDSAKTGSFEDSLLTQEGTKASSIENTSRMTESLIATCHSESHTCADSIRNVGPPRNLSGSQDDGNTASQDVTAKTGSQKASKWAPFGKNKDGKKKQQQSKAKKSSNKQSNKKVGATLFGKLEPAQQKKSKKRQSA